MGNSSEREAQGNLHHTRRSRADHLAEPSVHLVAIGIETRAIIDTQKLRVIEGIVYLAAELQDPLLRSQGNFLEESGIPVVDARTTEDIFRGVAGIAHGGAGEDGGIEPSQQAAVA